MHSDPSYIQGFKESELHKDLMKDYMVAVRPSEHYNTSLAVSFVLALTQIIDVVSYQSVFVNWFVRGTTQMYHRGSYFCLGFFSSNDEKRACFFLVIQGSPPSSMWFDY